MNISEEIVFHHLRKTGYFVTSHPWLKHPKKDWRARPDFLALDFHNEIIFVVEVSSDDSNKKAKALAERLKPEYRADLKEAIKSFINGKLEFRYKWHYYVSIMLARKITESLYYKQYYDENAEGKLCITFNEIISNLVDNTTTG